MASAVLGEKLELVWSSGTNAEPSGRSRMPSPLESLIPISIEEGFGLGRVDVVGRQAQLGEEVGRRQVTHAAGHALAQEDPLDQVLAVDRVGATAWRNLLVASGPVNFTGSVTGSQMCLGMMAIRPAMVTSKGENGVASLMVTTFALGRHRGARDGAEDITAGAGRAAPT